MLATLGAPERRRLGAAPVRSRVDGASRRPCRRRGRRSCGADAVLERRGGRGLARRALDLDDGARRAPWRSSTGRSAPTVWRAPTRTCGGVSRSVRSWCGSATAAATRWPTAASARRASCRRTDARRARRSMEAPEERFAALLGGREEVLPAEELVLRARADLNAGRLREAALQARVALEALLAARVASEDSGAGRRLAGGAPRGDRARPRTRRCARSCRETARRRWRRPWRRWNWH